jgi:hypothetical protein
MLVTKLLLTSFGLAILFIRFVMPRLVNGSRAGARGGKKRETMEREAVQDDENKCTINMKTVTSLLVQEFTYKFL